MPSRRGRHCIALITVELHSTCRTRIVSAQRVLSMTSFRRGTTCTALCRRKWFVFRRGGTLPAAVRQLLFLDGKHSAVFHLDVPHDANAADLIGEFYIVAAGFDAGDSQAL